MMTASANVPQFSDYEHYGEMAMEEWVAALLAYIALLEAKAAALETKNDELEGQAPQDT